MRGFDLLASASGTKHNHSFLTPLHAPQLIMHIYLMAATAISAKYL